MCSRQERLRLLLRERGPLSPARLWAALGVTKQATHDLLKPLLADGIVVREGTKHAGRYRLK